MENSKVSNGKTHKVAVFLHHALGDLLMAIPLLRVLQKCLDQSANIKVYVKSEIELSITKYIDLDKRFCFSIFNRKNIFAFINDLRKEKFDILLTPHTALGLKMAIFSRFTKASYIVGPYSKFASLLYHKTIKSIIGEHKVEYYCRFASAIGCSIEDYNLLLYPEKEIVSRVRQHYLKDIDTYSPIFILSPGSGETEKHKRWPLSNFSRLAELLLRRYPKCKVILIGAPSETHLLDQIYKEIKLQQDRVINITPSNIIEAYVIYSYCTLHIGNCSGALHLAAAAGIPVIGIYGPTNPGFTGPFSKKVRIVRFGLNCSPCYRVGFIKGCGNPACMSLIKPMMVFNAVLETLNGIFSIPVPWIVTTKASKPFYDFQKDQENLEIP